MRYTSSNLIWKRDQPKRWGERKWDCVRKTRRKSKVLENVRNLFQYLGNSKTIPKIHALSLESFLVASLIDPNLLLVQTSQNRRFSVVAPNYANIILKVRILKLPMKPYYPRLLVQLESKWRSGYLLSYPFTVVVNVNLHKIFWESS